MNFADKSLSELHVHTSGYGVTAERAAELKAAGPQAAGIGLDDVDPARNDLFRGYKGAFDVAVNAINIFREAGIFPYVYFCPSPEIIRSGDIYRYMVLMKSLGVGFVRWLEPKPCGGFIAKGNTYLLDHKDHEILINAYTELNSDPDFREFPPVSYEAFTESSRNIGCMMAGLSLLYIDSIGNVQPCVFLPVSFGNIMNEDIETIMDRMRRIIPGPLHSECPSVQLNNAIRSGMGENIPLPLPYDELTEEFYDLYKNAMNTAE